VQQDIFAESDAYEQFMGRWSRRLAPQLVKFASVGDRDTVLDIGPGTEHGATVGPNGCSCVEASR